MISVNIPETPFMRAYYNSSDRTRADRVKDAYFSNIRTCFQYRDTLYTDVTLPSVIRAMVKPRIPDDKTFLIFDDKNAASTNIQDTARYYGLSADYILCFQYWLNQERKEEVLRENYNTGEYTAFPMIEKAIRVKTGEIVYIRKDTAGNVIVMCDTVSYKVMRLLSVFIAILYPEIFDEEHPLTDEERTALGYIVFDDNQTRFCNAMQALLEHFNIEDKGIEEELRGLTQKLNNQQIAVLQASLNQQIEAMNHQWNRYLQEQEEYMRIDRQLESARQANNGSDKEDELIAYLRNNHDRIVLDDIREDGTISFWTKTVLTNYSQDEYEMCIANDSRLFMYKTPDLYMASEPLDAIRFAYDRFFGDDPAYAINMVGYYQLNIQNGHANTIRNFRTVDALMSNNYLPNPHLYYYSCLGDYGRYIAQYLANHDVIGAMEQCLTSSASIHFAENITAEKLVQDLWRRSGTFITRLSDDKRLSFIDAFEEGIKLWHEQNDPKQFTMELEQPDLAGTVTVDNPTGTSSTYTINGGQVNVIAPHTTYTINYNDLTTAADILANTIATADANITNMQDQTEPEIEIGF